MSTPHESPAGKTPRAFLIVVSLLALAVSTTPYVVGYFSVKGGMYLWAGTSPSDFAVYLAWMRTASHGGFRDLHLFAGGHAGMLINPVYWFLGAVSGLTRLPCFIVYHIGRIGFGAGLLYVLWRLVRAATSDPLTRRLAFLFLCFSSGFGWFLGFLTPYPSIDRWQPEAFTLLSLYTYPHFCAAIALQVCFLGLMIKSDLTGQAKYAALAGLCLGLLAIEHTYDAITVVAIRLAYMALSPAAWRAGGWKVSLRNHLPAGLCSLPGVLYIGYVWHADKVFAVRNNVMLSMPLPSVLIGYGGVLLLAIVGAYVVLREDSVPCNPGTNAPMGRLLVVWSVVNIAVSYIPVAFQRKLIQGEHVALSILAAVGAACLLRRAFPRWTWDRVRFPEIALALFLAIGSMVYLYRDTGVITQTASVHTLFRSTLTDGEAKALDWVDNHTARSDVIQPIPWRLRMTGRGIRVADMTLGLFVPGITGRPVYCAHWAETPDLTKRLDDVRRIIDPSTPDAERLQLLRMSKIAYLIVSPTQDPSSTAALAATSAEDGGRQMREVYANVDVAIYQVLARP